jgi:hypothetical protein
MGADGVFRVYSDDSCAPGQAVHTYQPNPGFPLDVIKGMGLTAYGHGTVRLAKAATNMGHWSDGGNPLVGTLASNTGSASTTLTFTTSEVGILSAGQILNGPNIPLADSIASVSGSIVTLTAPTTGTIAAGAETFTVFNGGVVPLLTSPPYTADYSVLDAAGQSTPIQCARYPDLVSGAYCPPQQVYVDTLYEQASNGVSYNSQPTYGLLEALGTAAITGTQYNGDTVEFSSIAGTGGTSVWGAELNVVVSGGGTLVPTQLAGGGTSVFDKMGEFSVPSVGGGMPSVVQTQSSVTCGTHTCESALSVNTLPYLQAGVFDPDNDVGPIARGIVLNSVPVTIYDQLTLNKVIYYPGMSNTTSYTVISVDSHGASWQGSGSGLFEFVSSGKEILSTGNVAAGDGMAHLNMVGSGGSWGCPLSIKDSPSIWMVAQGGSAVTCAVDNSIATAPVGGTFLASTGLSIGGGQGVITYGRELHVLDIEISSAITTAQWSKIQLSLIYATHIPPQISASITHLADDSRNVTNGDLTNAEHAPNMVRRYLPKWTAIYDKGVSGEPLCSITPAVIANKMAGEYDPSLQWEGIVIEDGGIDLGNLVTPAAVEACAITIVNYVRANYPVAGGAPHIIMESVVPGCGTFNGAAAGTSTKAQYVDQYMLWLYQFGFKPQAQGGLGLTPGWDQISNASINPLVSPGAYILNTWTTYPSVAVASGSNTITFSATGNAANFQVGQTIVKTTGSAIPANDTITAVNNGTVTLSSPTTGTIATTSTIDVYTPAGIGSTSVTLASTLLATQLTVGEQLLTNAPANTTITAINGEVVSLSTGLTAAIGDGATLSFGDYASANGTVTALNLQGSLLCGTGINDNNQTNTPYLYSTDGIHPSHALDMLYEAIDGQELSSLQSNY